MDIGENVEVEVPVGKELARVYLSEIVVGLLVEFWGKLDVGVLEVNWGVELTVRKKLEVE